MPQLLSRRDDTGWLTPSMADILKQGTAALPAEDLIRSQVNEIQQMLAELETPARIIDVRPSPSHILYIARPEIVGRRSNRRPVTPAEIRRSLGTIAEKHTDWTLGFLPKIQDDDESIGILLRTEEHQPLKLRQLVVGNAFLHHQSTLALVLGVTVDQQMIVRDLAALKHLLIVGSDSARRHLIREILLTLGLFNTPAEMRFALVGANVKTFDDFSAAPHILGRLIDGLENGVRLLDGMMKESERRRQWFLESQTESFQEYNAHLQRKGEPPVPRILVVLDSLSDPAWQEAHERWIPTVYDLLVNGAKIGVHLLLTANQQSDVPETLENALDTQFIMRSANPELAENLKNFHSSALRFIDAFIVDKKQAATLTAVELCAVGDDEIQRLTAYWRQMATQRTQDPKIQVRKTGFTDILPDIDPEPRIAAPMPTRTRVGTLAKATQALSSPDEDRILGQAQALAAYLGWIGMGPLRDVLGLSSGESRAILAALQNIGSIESGDGPVLRFVRLEDNPLSDSQPE
jgi:DNA segregation ATPase FtsK/SpoIIIE, S-DNA-T family